MEGKKETKSEIVADYVINFVALSIVEHVLIRLLKEGTLTVEQLNGLIEESKDPVSNNSVVSHHIDYFRRRMRKQEIIDDAVTMVYSHLTYVDNT